MFCPSEGKMVPFLQVSVVYFQRTMGTQRKKSPCVPQLHLSSDAQAGPDCCQPYCPLAVTARADATYVCLSMPNPCACLKREAKRAGYNSCLPFFSWQLRLFPTTAHGVSQKTAPSGSIATDWCYL